MLGAVSR